MTDSKRERLARCCAKFDWTVSEPDFEEFYAKTREAWLDWADAILDELREPTFDMVDDACFCAETDRDVYVDVFREQDDIVNAKAAHGDFVKRWQTAIDAAKEPK